MIELNQNNNMKTTKCNTKNKRNTKYKMIIKKHKHTNTCRHYRLWKRDKDDIGTWDKQRILEHECEYRRKHNIMTQLTISKSIIDSNTSSSSTPIEEIFKPSSSIHQA